MTESPPLLEFRLPSRYLELSLGHKRNKWYLVFGRERYNRVRPCCQEVVRLDTRRPGHRRSHPKNRPTRPSFWFRPDAETTWEDHGQTLLDMMLALGREYSPVLELTPNKRPMRGDTAKQVDVLVDLTRLSRWCEGCGRWESTEVVKKFSRWTMVGKEHGLPVYLCPKCLQKDWFGAKAKRRAMSAIRRLLRIS